MSDGCRMPAARMLATHERALWSIAALSLVAVGVCFLLVRVTGPLPGELPFEEWRVGGGVPEPLIRPLTFVTYMADTWVAVATVVVLAVVAADECGRRAGALILAAAGVVVLEAALSSVLGPTSQEYHGAAGVNLGPENNFPSGHAAFAVSVYGAAGFLAWNAGHRALAGALALPVVLMGPALALLGNHYPADVLAGYALGLAWLLAVLLIGERTRPAR